MSKEVDNNQNAPELDNAGTAVEGEADGTIVKPSDASEGGDALNENANNAQTKPDGFNAETSFKELQDRYGKLDASYKEIRRAYTQSTQKSAQFEKQLSQITEMLAKATETPIDPQQFIRDVQTHGHKPILDLIQREQDKARKGLEDKYGKSLDETKSYAATLEAKLLKSEMRADVENFPGFRELEPVMADLLEDPALPISPDLSIQEQMVALYKLAKVRSADNAIRQAHADGAAAKEKELAKEAGTTVAGGGKAPGVTQIDWDKLSPEEHRKKLIQLYGIAER